MKTFILSYSTQARDNVVKWADESPLVSYWRTELPFSIFLVSDSSAFDLAKSFEKGLGDIARYVISEIGDGVQGRLTEESWKVINQSSKRVDYSKRYMLDTSLFRK